MFYGAFNWGFEHWTKQQHQQQQYACYGQAPLIDTEGITEGVRINGMSVLSGSYYWSKKKTFLLEQNHKGIKEDISIVELKLNLHKAVITRRKSTETEIWRSKDFLNRGLT